jgi:hypothetical protein
MSVNIDPKQPTKASSNDLDTDHKSELEKVIDRSNKIIHDKMTDIQVEASTTTRKHKPIRFGPETIEVNISMTEGVYKVARLICQFEYDHDWNAYVSELVRQDAFSMLSGDRNLFKDYAERVLADEDDADTLTDY